ncbi:MAG: Dabb family protein [Chitinophagaceae bacterium]
MKRNIFLLIAVALLTGATYEAMSQPSSNSTMKDQPVNQLRHIVLLKFKDSSTPAQVKEVENAFSVLPGKINTITGYEWGTNVSPENLAQGFTHCFMVSFKDQADRDKYLPHAAHKDFVKILTPHLDKVLVIDFVGKIK